MLDPRPPLDVGDAEEEPEEVGVGASVWMENICSDEEDWAITTGSSIYVMVWVKECSSSSSHVDARRKTYLA
jgi:hypothetical protein